MSKSRRATTPDSGPVDPDPAMREREALALARARRRPITAAELATATQVPYHLALGALERLAARGTLETRDRHRDKRTAMYWLPRRNP